MATIGPVPASGGGDGGPITEAELTGDAESRTGIFALDKADLFNLLCVPPPDRESDTPPGTYAAALAYCVARRAMLIVDPPGAWSANPSRAVAEVTAGLGSLGIEGQAARNAALFFPLLVAPDPLDENRPHTFTPSGAVAGVIARTDAGRGVWKAPAGTDATIRGIADLSMRLGEASMGTLNRMGVNCLRMLPGREPVIWGARTMRGADAHADEYRYIPVRRLALFIEESVSRSLQGAVFEPNDESLWSSIRLGVGELMNGLFRQGALQGRTPREAYFVKCDQETTTRGDVEAGFVNVVIGFAPAKPGEFLIIRLRQAAGPAA